MSKFGVYSFCVCAVCLFFVLTPLLAQEQPAIPQQVLGWQKAAQEFAAQGNTSQAAQYYQKIIQFNKASSDFSAACKATPTMPHDIYDLANRFEASGQVDKAIVFYQAGVNWSANSDKSQGIWNDPAFYQMLSQANLIKIYIRNKDFTAALTASDVFKTKYADQPTLAKEIHQIADQYAESGQQAKAFELYQYNAACPSNIEGTFKPENIWLDPEYYRMKSQVVVIRQQIQNNDFSAAESGCEVLTTRYTGQSTLPAEIYQIAQAYQNAGQSDKASALHQAIIKLPVPEGGISYQPQSAWEDPEVCRMWSQVEITRKLIRDRDFTGAQAACETLMTRFKEVQLLPREMYLIAEDYEMAGQGDKAQALYQAAAKIPKPQKACYEPRSSFYDPDLYRMESQRKVVEYCIGKQDFAGADKEYQSLLEQYKDHPTLPQEIDRVATKYMRAGQTSKAMELGQFLLDQNADPAWQLCGHAVMARVYVQMGQDANVREKVDYLLSNFKDNPAGVASCMFDIGEEYYNRAFMNGKQGRLAENSSEALNKAIEIWQKPIYPEGSKQKVDAMYFTATTYLYLRQYEAAIETYKKVMGLQSGDGYAQAGNILGLIGRCYEGMAEDGLNDPNQVMKLTPEQALAEAETAWQTVVGKYPDNPMSFDAAMRLAQAKERKGQWREAAEAYKFFLANCGGDIRKVQTTFKQGNAYEQAGQKDLAREAYTEYVQAAPVGDRYIPDAAKALLRLAGVGQ
jgi:tetratricopeptide (TPR) repeat protein